MAEALAEMPKRAKTVDARAEWGMERGREVGVGHARAWGALGVRVGPGIGAVGGAKGGVRV